MLIQKLRLQHGWSQEQLAELSGLSVRTIQRLERGQNASVESLKALGSVFAIDFSLLKAPERDPDMESSATANRRADEELAFARVRKIKGFPDYGYTSANFRSLYGIGGVQTRRRRDEGSC